MAIKLLVILILCEFLVSYLRRNKGKSCDEVLYHGFKRYSPQAESKLSEGINWLPCCL